MRCDAWSLCLEFYALLPERRRYTIEGVEMGGTNELIGRQDQGGSTAGPEGEEENFWRLSFLLLVMTMLKRWDKICVVAYGMQWMFCGLKNWAFPSKHLISSDMYVV